LKGKIDELQKIFGDSLANEANLASLMGENKATYEKRLQERLAKRRERLEQGMNEEEVDKLEAEEDKQFEEEMQKKSTGNALLDLEVLIIVLNFSLLCYFLWNILYLCLISLFLSFSSP